MKTLPLILAALLVAVACPAQPRALPPPSGDRDATPAKEAVNYLIRVDWLQPKGESKFLEVLTTEGSVSLDTIQKNSVKINNNDVPITLKLSGTLTAISAEKGRLQIYLGRTVPYVTSSMPSGSSTYSQMSVGISSNIIVTYGKPVVIQSDENGQISVLVKRITD